MIGTPEKAQEEWLTLRERRESIKQLEKLSANGGNEAHAMALQEEKQRYRELLGAYVN